MVKWYHIYKVTCNYVSVLKCNHAITLADESARLRFTAVKWYRGVMVMWYRGVVVVRCFGIVVAWHRGVVASNYRSSNAPECMRAGELESCELRAGAATKNLT